MRRIDLPRGLFALVDDADFDEVNRHRWSLDSKGYAVRSVRGKPVFMHREIMGTPKGFVTHHVDGDRLNNQRANLRPCSKARHTLAHLKGKPPRARSGFFGVYAVGDRWLASARIGGKLIRLGVYDSPVDAARARDAAVSKRFWWGDDARLNFQPPASWVAVRLFD